MSVKQEIFELLDARIDQLKSSIDYFEKFGNPRTENVLRCAIDREKLTELKLFRNDLTYTVGWKKE